MARKLTRPKPELEVPTTELSGIYQRIREILESARAGVARTVNTTQVVANWLIGQELVEEEQRGRRRAGYGEALVRELSSRLSREFGAGYSKDNLFWFRRFYVGYPHLLMSGKFDASRQISNQARIVDAAGQIFHTLRGELDSQEVAKPWEPGRLSTNLSWTHYRTLLRTDSSEARAFYEIEAIRNNWSARELERQINSLLFERLAKSRDKTGLMKLATRGQEIATAADVFKDPVVIEFLGLPESHRLVESDLELALINSL